ncbi:MAG TPA: hemerythrin domain-containing protein, partial [Dehalococcoidia bacterium]|nr:hemerythrin domain-containing protein [Dehalococcoidia bacterium]
MVNAIDPIALLKQDHSRVMQLFMHFESAGRGFRPGILSDIERALQIHSKIEEEIFYPAVRAIGDQIVAEAIEEHNVVDHVLEELRGVSPDDDEYVAKFKVLKENVEHHIEEEEGAIFPEAMQKLGAGLAQLGRQMMERKQELMNAPMSSVSIARPSVAPSNGHSGNGTASHASAPAKPKAAAKPHVTARPKAKAKPKAAVKAMAAAKPRAAAKPKTAAKPKPRATTRAKAVAKPKMAAKAKPRATTKAAARPKAAAKPRTAASRS